MKPYQSLREEAWEANRSLVRYGLVLFTFGNVSAADRERGVFAIKPSGMPFGTLRPEDLVVVDFEGEVVTGNCKPSTDTPTHCVLYQSFPGIGGITHTHSTFATAWSQAGLPIPVLGTTHADHLPIPVPCTRPLECTDITADYERATGLQIVQTLAGLSPLEVPMVLVHGHGPVTWGATSEQAVYHNVVLEELARLAYLTQHINPAVPALAPALIGKHFQRKHGSGAYYGQT